MRLRARGAAAGAAGRVACRVERGAAAVIDDVAPPSRPIFTIGGGPAPGNGAVSADNIGSSIGGGAAGAGAGIADDVFRLTPDGVALPKGPKYAIPERFVDNPYRPGSHGEVVDGRFVERLRIDPPTPPGTKGPDYSHYHLDGGRTHHSPRPGDTVPGFPQ